MPSQAQSTDHEPARRIIAMSSLAAKEYSEGVVDGVVILSDEVDEARLFLEEAARAARNLTPEIGLRVGTLIDSARQAVSSIAPPERVSALAGEMARYLDEALGGLEEPIPQLRPELSDGRRIFAQNCTECHGDGGTGDGFRAASLSPPPASLTDAGALADQAPLDHFRKIRFGVAGTDMSGFEDKLDDTEIWSVVWYIARLRASDSVRAHGREVIGRICPACVADPHGPTIHLSGTLPHQLTDAVSNAQVTDEELWNDIRTAASIAGEPIDSADAVAAVAYARTLPFAEASAPGVVGVFSRVRATLARAARESQQGHPEAAAEGAFDAYTVFESVETDVAARDPALTTNIEAGFGDFRARLARGDDPELLTQSYASLLEGLASAQAVLVRPTSSVGLFVQSFVLLVREGLEAILIVGALAAVLVRSGTPKLRQGILWGVLTAVLASVITAVLMEAVFRIGAAEREVLEGITMLVATGVLVFVSYWLLAKVEVNRWKAFVTAQVRRAISTGSMFALAGASFLAVYREGFETVLFYKALFITAEGQGAGAIGAGAALGAVVLAVVYFAISRASLRLPLRPFFAVTSAILFYMAFTFAGKGIAELQSSRLVRTTLVEWAPSIPWMGIYPTLQTLIIQLVLLALLAFGILWTFVIQTQRPAGG